MLLLLQEESFLIIRETIHVMIAVAEKGEEGRASLKLKGLSLRFSMIKRKKKRSKN
jgi:hypothetical protein